jgi:hypothetical protein
VYTGNEFAEKSEKKKKTVYDEKKFTGRILGMTRVDSGKLKTQNLLIILLFGISNFHIPGFHRSFQ